MSESQQQSQTHESREECFEAEDFLDPGASEPNMQDYGENIDVVYTCPTCDRKWEYVYTMEGVWDPDAEEYFHRGGF